MYDFFRSGSSRTRTRTRSFKPWLGVIWWTRSAPRPTIDPPCAARWRLKYWRSSNKKKSKSFITSFKVNPLMTSRMLCYFLPYPCPMSRFFKQRTLLPRDVVYGHLIELDKKLCIKSVVYRYWNVAKVVPQADLKLKIFWHKKLVSWFFDKILALPPIYYLFCSVHSKKVLILTKFGFEKNVITLSNSSGEQKQNCEDFFFFFLSSRSDIWPARFFLYFASRFKTYS